MLYIWGYFGGFNLGDELILLVWKNLLEESRMPFTIVSRNPDLTRYLWNVEATHPQLALLSSGIHIIGGGGLLQNKTSGRSLIYYCLPALFHPSYLVGVGLGPLKRGLSKLFLNAALGETSGRIWVRDKYSQIYLNRLGFHSDLVPDLVHLLGVPERNSDADSVLVVLGPKLGWKQVVEEYSPQDAVVMAFHQNELGDLLVLKTLGYRVYWAIRLLFSGDFFSIFSSFGRVWAGRLHALVLASLSGADVRLAPYDPKMVAYWRTWFDSAKVPIGEYANIGKAAEQVRQIARLGYAEIIKRLSVEGQQWE